jgi:hypothetical protein
MIVASRRAECEKANDEKGVGRKGKVKIVVANC